MTKVTRTLAFGVLVLLGVSLSAQAGRQKKVAVLDFDDTAVQRSSQNIFGSRVDVGRELSKLVVDYLAVDGTYDVVERHKIEKALAKKKFASPDLSKLDSIRQVGKALRADAILVGRIAHFGWGKRSRRRRRRPSSGKALVVVHARLVDIREGKVLSETKSRGESTGSATKLLDGHHLEHAEKGTVDFSRSDFQSTPLGDAVVAVVDKLGRTVLDAGKEWGARPFSVTAVIQSVNGQEAVLNVGQGLGLEVGRRLPVLRVTGEVKDRASGIVLRKLTRRVAVVEVVSVDDLSVVTRVVSGGDIRVGDGVKIVMP